MADTLQTISIVAIILCSVLLVVAVVLYVKLRIKEVMADLSGKTAQRSIEEIRNRSKKSTAGQRHKSYSTNGKSTTETKKKKATSEVATAKESTQKLRSEPTVQLSEDRPAADPNATVQLSPDEAKVDTNATVQLTEPPYKPDPNATVQLTETEPDTAATTVLSPPKPTQGTTVLEKQEPKAVPHSDFVMITDIMLISTDEVMPTQNEFVWQQ